MNRNVDPGNTIILGGNFQFSFCTSLHTHNDFVFNFAHLEQSTRIVSKLFARMHIVMTPCPDLGELRPTHGGSHPSVPGLDTILLALVCVQCSAFNQVFNAGPTGKNTVNCLSLPHFCCIREWAQLHRLQLWQCADFFSCASLVFQNLPLTYLSSGSHHVKA